MSNWLGLGCQRRQSSWLVYQSKETKRFDELILVVWSSIPWRRRVMLADQIHLQERRIRRWTENSQISIHDTFKHCCWHHEQSLVEIQLSWKDFQSLCKNSSIMQINTKWTYWIRSCRDSRCEKELSKTCSERHGNRVGRSYRNW